MALTKQRGLLLASHKQWEWFKKQQQLQTPLIPPPKTNQKEQIIYSRNHRIHEARLPIFGGIKQKGSQCMGGATQEHRKGVSVLRFLMGINSLPKHMLQQATQLNKRHSHFAEHETAVRWSLKCPLRWAMSNMAKKQYQNCQRHRAILLVSGFSGHFRFVDVYCVYCDSCCCRSFKIQTRD